MNIEDLQALVEKRRSTRGYDENRTVSIAMIRTILDCARWAPSGGNGQPWEFVVVREQSVRYKIADCYMKQMEQKREMDLAVRGTAKMTGDGFRHAPVHIVVLGDPRVKEAYPIRTKLEKAESHFISEPCANPTMVERAVRKANHEIDSVADPNATCARD